MSEKTPRSRPSVVDPASRPVFGVGQIVALLCAIDLALCLVYLLNFLFPIPSGMFTRLVDIDGESSIANWYSSMKLFLIGGLFLHVALEKFDRVDPKSWMLVAFPVVFWGMSADEVVQIHEWLGWVSDILLPGGTREETFFQVTGIWMFVIAVPFFTLFLALLFSMRWYFNPGSGSLSRILGGIGILFGGAAGVEVLTNLVPEADSLGFHLQAFAEELLEMWGASVILWGVALLVVSGKLRFGFQSDQSRNKEVVADRIPRSSHHAPAGRRGWGKSKGKGIKTPIRLESASQGKDGREE